MIQRAPVSAHEFADRPADAEDLLAHLLEQSRPLCAQRFLRHQDIRLASIGALRWRGHLPPDDTPRDYWERLFRAAGDGIGSWLDGTQPSTDLARRTHQAEGDPTPRKRDLVTTFLAVPPQSSVFFDWLAQNANEARRSIDRDT